MAFDNTKQLKYYDGAQWVDVFGVAPGEDTIVSHPTLGVGLSSYYKADNDATDAHGSNDGTFTPATYATGIINNGFDLDGVNDRMQVADAGDFTFGSTSDDFSISGWFQFNNLSQNNTVFDKRDNNNDGWVLILLQSTQKFGFFMDATDSFSVANAVTDTNLHHVLVTVDRTGAGLVTIYIDGVDVSLTQPSVASEELSVTTDFSIGMDAYATSNQTDGVIDEVAIWSKVLTQAEVTDLYNSGAGLPYN